MNARYYIVVLLCISCASCSDDKKKAKPNEDQTQRPKTSESTKNNKVWTIPRTREEELLINEANRQEILNKIYEEHQAFVNSNYIFSKSEIRRVTNNQGDNTEEQATFNLIKKTYNEVKQRIRVVEGTKILVSKEGRNFIIRFYKALPRGMRGTSNIADITVDGSTGKVIKLKRG